MRRGALGGGLPGRDVAEIGAMALVFGMARAHATVTTTPYASG